ncbi:MAG: class I SAM-dependent methyltransferase [Planctomycetes bacterium]|nr:class I SAM-dependent methyltransferase [Planctomycetota bacterium]
MTTSRVLDLRELDRPFFRETIDLTRKLVEEFPGFYLHPSKQWEYPWALESAALPLNSRVLDVGCGASVLPLYLDRLGHRVIACDIDLDWDLVEQTPLPYIKADLTALPFEKAQFEAVFCISVLEHLPLDRMIPVLWELHRVLRAGGRLLLTADFYEDHWARVAYSGPGRRFPVNWNVFDRDLLEQIIFAHPGFLIANPPDLNVDWPTVKEQMLRFHGYPYTSIGLVLVKR